MLLDKVRKTISRYRLIDKGDTLVVGVSGGPDSIALIYLLHSLKKELGIKLHIAHLDHKLRPDSYKDRRFVENLAYKLEVPLTAEEINVHKISAKGSLEETARNARLRFLFKVAGRKKSVKIALGHNLDDQAETVLMRILRGSGLYGLAGILPQRKISGYKIIRPLIEVSRRDIETFLRKRRIRPRLDSSNLEDIYFRNRIRNRLLPLLKKEYNRNIAQLLSNMAEGIGYDYDYLRRAAALAARKLKTRIDLKRFLRYHPALRRLVLRINIERLNGDLRRITFQHAKELEDLVLNRPIGSIVDLPKGISAIKKRKYLYFYRRQSSFRV